MCWFVTKLNFRTEYTEKPPIEGILIISIWYTTSENLTIEWLANPRVINVMLAPNAGTRPWMAAFCTTVKSILCRWLFVGCSCNHRARWSVAIYICLCHSSTLELMPMIASSKQCNWIIEPNNKCVKNLCTAKAHKVLISNYFRSCMQHTHTYFTWCLHFIAAKTIIKCNNDDTVDFIVFYVENFVLDLWVYPFTDRLATVCFSVRHFWP